MSTEHAVDGRGVTPTTLDDVLDDLEETDFEPPEDPTHDLTTAAVGGLELRTHLPHSDIDFAADEVGLTPTASAWPTPEYPGNDGDVSLSLSADGDDGCRTSTCAELSPADARNLAVQLLASAAVVDDDQEDKLPGYASE